jgi:hypothetical protein
MVTVALPSSGLNGNVGARAPFDDLQGGRQSDAGSGRPTAKRAGILGTFGIWGYSDLTPSKPPGAFRALSLVCTILPQPLWALGFRL